MFRSRITVKFIIGLPVAKLNQKLSRVYVEKRQNGGRILQRALSVPFLLQCGRVSKGRGWVISR